jgi:hypothetical protein
VPDQLEIRGPHGERLLTPVHEGTFVVGSDESADVRIDWPGIAGWHFRFVRTATVVRIEPMRPGGTVEVNGQALFCKDLRAGDVIDVAGVQLRWLPEAPAAPSGAAAGPVEGAAPRAALRAPLRTEAREDPVGTSGRGTAGGTSGAAARVRGATTRVAAGKTGARLRPRARRTPVWVPVLSLSALVCVAALLGIRHFQGSTWPNSPQHYVDLARAQFGNHDPERALVTLGFALREATGATRTEALQLEADIRRMLLETAERPKIAIARQEHDLLLEFSERYLRDGGERPAVRELVRACDQWLQRHREVCALVTEGGPLLRTIEELRARHVAAAALSEPDTAADVIFAARARLRFQWRDYRGAMARLDAFLAARPADPDVVAERAKLLAEGERWLQGKLRSIDGLLDRGDTDNAERDLAQLERWSALPEWAAAVAERKQRLPAAR